MGVTEEAAAQRFDKAAWAVALAAALVLNVSGWFLPTRATTAFDDAEDKLSEGVLNVPEVWR